VASHRAAHVEVGRRHDSSEEEEACCARGEEPAGEGIEVERAEDAAHAARDLCGAGPVDVEARRAWQVPEAPRSLRGGQDVSSLPHGPAVTGPERER
jgi:hypothetical protein